MALQFDKERHNSDPIQGFAPNRIESATTTLNVTDVLAFVAASDITYQINAAGQSILLPMNTIRVVGTGVTAITFTGTVSFEIMDK